MAQGTPGLRVLVEGRRVAVVGNAESIRGAGCGQAIDARPVVLRINAKVSPGEAPEDVGVKTSAFIVGKVVRGWVFDGKPRNLEKVKEERVAAAREAWRVMRLEHETNGTFHGVPVIWRSEGIEEAAHKMWDPLNPDSPRNLVHFSGGSRPPGFVSTGLVAIYDCLLCQAGSIDLFGFDCWKSGDRYLLPNEDSNINAAFAAAERKRMKILIEDYGVRPDAILRAALYPGEGK